MTGKPDFHKALVAGLLLIIFGGGVVEAGGKGAPEHPAFKKIVYLPVYGNDETIRRYRPLTEYLRKNLVPGLEASSADSYRDVIFMLTRGDFDIAYLSASTYSEASQTSKIEVVAMELDKEGRRGYYSIFISRAGGGIETMEQGRGKVLAFVNPDSASGFQVPLQYFLNDLKTMPGSFAREVVFAGDHGAVIAGVLSGKYDLGATNTIDLEREAKEKNIPLSSFTVLWKSGLIPGSPVCVRAGTPAEARDALLHALLAFNKNREDLQAIGIGGFAPASGKDYEEFIRAVQCKR